MTLAARGARNMDGGEESMTDPLAAAGVRQQARKVYLESSAAAVVLTALSLVVPE